MGRVWLLFVFLWVPAIHGQTLSDRIYGGSGSDSINGVAVDSSGNIWTVGATTSFDLPLLNPSQAANTGTQLVYSPDAGLTWKPLVNLPAAASPISGPLQIAVDPTNPAVVFVANGPTVFKSTDGGQHFSAGATLPGLGTQAYISSLVIDHTAPSLLYATTLLAGTVFKSADGGDTWTQLSGLPASGDYASVVLDPFHTKSLWVWAGSIGYISTDGGNTWNDVPLPFSGSALGGVQFIFDAATPGTVYGPAWQSGSNGLGLQKSTDDGKTWSAVTTPFNAVNVVADPVRAGYLYALDEQQNPALFYRTQNGGATWQSFTFPSGLGGIPVADPANPNILVAGTFRSTDDGQTWSPVGVSRSIQAVFAPSGKGLVYAAAPITSDVFLAEFAPDGNTLLFATYFGGMGNETASAIQIDSSGNIWVGGSTSSFDLPVSSQAFQTTLKGSTNEFLAKFSSTGQLLAATYLGGSDSDTMKSFKLDSGGNVWMLCQASSLDFPITIGQAPVIRPESANLFVTLSKVDPLASQLLYSAYVTSSGEEQAGGLSVDPSGNIVITGITFTASFPVSPNVIHVNPLPTENGLYAFVLKLDSSGHTVFSTFLGGTTGAPTQTDSNPANLGVAVATDASGIYLTGNTSAVDYPTTPGAYQTQFHGGCTYPSSAIYTGMIGTIYEYAVDDVFITKLSPDGQTLIYSTLLGGSCYDRPTDLLVSPSGSVFVAGETNSIDFPVVHPLENGPSVEQYKSFVSELDASGSTLPFSTYLSAGSQPVLALGPDGALHVGGSSGYLAQTQTNIGSPIGPAIPNTDGFLAAINFSGSPAALDLTEVLNAFSLMPGAIAPGEILALTVPGFQPKQPLDAGLNELLPLGASLGDTQVLIDGSPVSIVSVFPGKIVCIAPRSFVSQQSASIQVNQLGAASNPLIVDIVPSALGLLSLDQSGQGLANARNADGTLNSPNNPAHGGSFVTLYFTGAGVPPESILVNGTPASMSSLNGFVPGIYAAYFQLPTSPAATAPASLGVSIQSNDSMSQTLTIYIQ